MRLSTVLVLHGSAMYLFVHILCAGVANEAKWPSWHYLLGDHYEPGRHSWRKEIVWRLRPPAAPTPTYIHTTYWKWTTTTNWTWQYYFDKILRSVVVCFCIVAFCGMSLSRSQKVTLAFVPKISASLSLVGSTWIIVEILTLKEKRNNVYNRLLCAMSFFDVIISAWYFASTWPIPAENADVAWAAENELSCTVQGFFLQMGITPPICRLLLSFCPCKFWFRKVAEAFECYMDVKRALYFLRGGSWLFLLVTMHGSMCKLFFYFVMNSISLYLSHACLFSPWPENNNDW